MNKKAICVATLFLCATTVWLGVTVYWIICHKCSAADVLVAMLAFIAAVVMVCNEWHKKKRRHVEDVKRYL